MRRERAEREAEGFSARQLGNLSCVGRAPLVAMQASRVAASIVAMACFARVCLEAARLAVGIDLARKLDSPCAHGVPTLISTRSMRACV